MAIRSAIRSWIKKAFRGLDWKHSAEVEREASAPPISIHNHFPKTGDAGRPTRFLLEKYQVNEEAKIEYVDKSGSRTTRTIQTEEVYEYSDGGLVIRAYCHKRKDYRAFIGDRIQSWKDTVTGAIVTNLGEHLRAQSGSDPGNIAEDIYTSHIVEINVAVGGLVKYSRTKGDFDYAVTGAKKMALIDYIVEKPEVVATLSTLPASDREDARDSLATMIADTTVSELTFEAAKKAFRKSRHEKKLDFISFIKETLKGDPSQSSTIGILTDDLIKTAPKKGENLIHPKEKITRKAVNKIKREEAAAKKAYKKKRKKADRSAYYRSYERKNAVRGLAQEQAIYSLKERESRNEIVFSRIDFEKEVVDAGSMAMTPRELAEESDIFLARCKHGISLGLLVFGLKKKNGGWYANESGEWVIDLRNKSVD